MKKDRAYRALSTDNLVWFLYSVAINVLPANINVPSTNIRTCKLYLFYIYTSQQDADMLCGWAYISIILYQIKPL